MSETEEVKINLGAREKAALCGWLVGVFSALGYAILYPRVQVGSFNALLKVVFIFITLIDYLAKRLQPDFSLTYTLLYSFKFAPLGFIFMLVYLGLLGAALGVLASSLYSNLKNRTGATSQP